MIFEWDPQKARLNLQKHRVSFNEAATAVLDPLAKTAVDPYHSISECRFITFGVSLRGRLLGVSYTQREETGRIISARRATGIERKVYEED